MLALVIACIVYQTNIMISRDNQSSGRSGRQGSDFAKLLDKGNSL